MFFCNRFNVRMKYNDNEWSKMRLNVRMKWNHGFSGYQERLIDNEMKKFKCNQFHFNGKHKSKKGILLVITFHPLLKSLSKIISKNLYLLYMDEKVMRVFTPGLMVLFRFSGKLISYLVTAKLFPIERVVGFFKWNKPRCLVCVNVTEINTFTRTVTGKTYKINHKFDCDKSYLVYLLMCRHCSIQYVELLQTFVTDGTNIFCIFTELIFNLYMDMDYG